MLTTLYVCITEHVNIIRLVRIISHVASYKSSVTIIYIYIYIYENLEVVIEQVVAVASLPKEIAAGLEPKQNNAIRGLLLQSGWVVEQLEGDDSCMVTYVVQVII